MIQSLTTSQVAVREVERTMVGEQRGEEEEQVVGDGSEGKEEGRWGYQRHG